MKLNAGIITEKLAETKAFYTENLNFGVSFENDFYLLLHTPNHEAEISFLFPHHPSQQPVFQLPFQNQGVYLTLEVENVDEFYNQLKTKNIPIEVDLRDEPWGDRHFAIKDPQRHRNRYCNLHRISVKSGCSRYFFTLVLKRKINENHRKLNA